MEEKQKKPIIYITPREPGPTPENWKEEMERLRFEKGWTYGAIAYELNVPIGTVRSHFYRLEHYRKQEIPESLVCPNCGKSFKPRSAKAVFCCDACRMHYNHHKSEK